MYLIVWSPLSPRRFTIFVVALSFGAALLLVPRVEDGLWEPGETAAAAELGNGVAAQSETLTERLAALTTSWFGVSDSALRMPGVLCGIALLFAALWLGYVVGGAEISLLSGLILLTSPGIFLQSIRVTGDIGLGLAATVTMLGMFLCERHLIGLLVVAAGGVLAWNHQALGLFVPLCAIGLAYLQGDESKRRKQGLVLIFLVVALSAWRLFTWREGYPGERALFGWRPELRDPLAPWFPGSATHADPNSTFESLLEPIAFGLFPWSVLIIIAGYAAFREPLSVRERAIAWWAFLSWSVATAFDRVIDHAGVIAALPALSILIAVWLRRFWTSDPASRFQPVLGLFVLLAAVVLGRDLVAAPEQLFALANAGEPTTLKGLGGVALILFAFAVIFGFAFFVETAVLRWRLPSSRMIVVAAACLSAATVAFVMTPLFTDRVSKKAIFTAYHRHARAGEPLGFVGDYGDAPRRYAAGASTKIASRYELMQFLGDKARRLAIVNATELCGLHGDIAEEQRFFVLERVGDLLLLTNQLLPEEADFNPLASWLRRSEPKDIGRRVSATFQDQIEIVGVAMPQRVESGEDFEITFTYRVLSSIRGKWDVFVHFEGEGNRFKGDHKAINGLCSTQQWRPGSIVIDRFSVRAGSPGRYQVWTGFFRDNRGKAQNMPVASAETHANDRVLIGVLEVR
jgi:4-amino-4-deoxy-L-arabinose transferase-like glycosyltransferase